MLRCHLNTAMLLQTGPTGLETWRGDDQTGCKQTRIPKPFYLKIKPKASALKMLLIIAYCTGNCMHTIIAGTVAQC